MDQFVLKAPYSASGDQPQAIEALAAGVKAGLKDQILLGVTGSGKTFTMASVIEKVQKPTLVIAHNKTLAAQLCSELRAFFPDSRVEYFVSYYDYYQPEAYIASSDTYIEKDASVNDEIDRRAEGTERCNYCSFSQLHLFHGRPQRIRRTDAQPAARHDLSEAEAAAGPDRYSVRAE